MAIDKDEQLNNVPRFGKVLNNEPRFNKETIICVLEETLEAYCETNPLTEEEIVEILEDMVTVYKENIAARIPK